MNLEPIRPLEYITDRDPIPEEVMDSSAWFKTETMELDVGEYVGRPQAAALFHTSFIMPLLAEGWYIDAVLDKGEGGTWTSSATAQAQQNSSAQSSSSATSSSDSSASTIAVMICGIAAQICLMISGRAPIRAMKSCNHT